MEKRINNIGSYVFIISAFVIPLIFSAFPLISFQFSKIIPFFLVLFFAIFLFIVQVFNEGKISVPTSWFFAAAGIVPIAYVISSFFSINKGASFLGTGTEVGTASFIAGSFIFMYLVSLFARSKDKIFMVYLSFGGAYIILAVFHILRFIFGPSFLSFGVFNSLLSNTLGRFTDLALVSGVAVILSLTSLEFFKLGRGFKILGYTILGLSLAMLAITNFPVLIWGVDISNTIGLFTIIGFFALVFFVYFVSSSYDQENKKARRVPLASLIVLIVSIIFTIGFAPLQYAINSYFKVDSNPEARLLWKPTADISWSTLSHLPVYRPLFGYGPEQYSYKWMLDKPVDINNTILWNTNFENGSGFIPSTIVTVGIVGFLAWLAFLVLFVWLGIKALFKKITDPFSHYLTISSFLVALYLWIIEIFYTPSIVTMFMTFLFTGLFLASLFREGVLEEKEVVFDKSKGRSFIFIMSLIVLLIASLFWAYKIGVALAASVYANKANVALQSAQSVEDVEKAKVYLQSAGTLANEDIYSRALANISLAQVNSILQDTTTPADELRTKFQTVYSQALAYARNAVAVDPKSFDNYITLGNVIEAAVPLNIPDSYESAKATYAEAAKLNPKSPLVPYLLARLEIDHKDIPAAKAHIGEALTLKSNYLDAIILLGRIQIGEGKNDDALASFTVAQSLDPQNTDIQAVISAIKSGNIGSSSSTNTPNTATTTTATTTKK